LAGGFLVTPSDHSGLPIDSRLETHAEVPIPDGRAECALLRQNECISYIGEAPAASGVNMAETLEHREKIQRSLEDIHRSLVAVSMKLAQLQLDAESDTELGDTLEDGMTALAPLIDRLESLASAFQMETNRLRNEGEL
jgi:hypothetical protein